MKHNKKIILKSERLRKIRYNLRRIIINCVYDEIEILRNFANMYGAILDLTPEEEKEVYFLQGTKQELLSALNKSICVCNLCSNDDRDMVYIELYDAWYCTKCQDKDLIWYPVNGSEEDKRQHDYISYYYKQKEKFLKKYHKKIGYN